MTRPQASHCEPAKISGHLLSLFLVYIQRSLGTHFHAVRLAVDGLPPGVEFDRPLVVYLNHASWWDPLMMMWLAKQCYPGRPQYGPIEAEQLKRYGFFKYLGVFGVEKGTVLGAKNFLRISDAILAQRGSMIWMTPQGRFADVRERPLSFASGLAHLARRQPNAVFVPLALEYAFGQERHPEIFMRFGNAIQGLHSEEPPELIQEKLEAGLMKALNALSEDVCSRDKRRFKMLLQGRGGASLPYDLWRRTRAFFRREVADLNHGAPQ